MMQNEANNIRDKCIVLEIFTMYIPSASKILLLLAASTAATLADKVGGYNATCGEVRLDDNGNPQDLTGDCDSDSTQFTRKTRLDLNLSVPNLT